MNDSRTWPDAWLEPALQAMGVFGADAEARLRRIRTATLWQAAVRAGIATHEEIVAHCSRRFGMPIADMSSADLTGVANLLPEETARRLNVLPLRQAGRVVEVACVNPVDLDLEQSVAFALGHRARLLLTDPDSLDAAQTAAYRKMLVAVETSTYAPPDWARDDMGALSDDDDPTLMPGWNPNAKELYMALAQADKKTWRLAFTTSLSQKPRVRQVRGGDLAWVVEEITKAKNWFRLAPAARVISYYEPGIDGAELHRELVKLGIDSHVVDGTGERRLSAKVDAELARK